MALAGTGSGLVGWGLGALGAIGVGALAAYMDFHNEAVQVAVGVILVGTFCLGFARPGGAWLWALIAGVCIFVANRFGPSVGLHPKFPAEPNAYATLIALIPAFIGAYAGALARWGLRAVMVGAGTRA